MVLSTKLEGKEYHFCVVFGMTQPEIKRTTFQLWSGCSNHKAATGGERIHYRNTYFVETAGHLNLTDGKKTFYLVCACEIDFLPAARQLLSTAGSF